jgi:hypothetical protein
MDDSNYPDVWAPRWLQYDRCPAVSSCGASAPACPDVTWFWLLAAGAAIWTYTRGNHTK